MTKVLYAGNPDQWPVYAKALPEAFQRAGITADLVRGADAPETVDYIVYAPSSGLSDFAPFTGCKAVLSLWAGVEAIEGNPTLTQPLARMVDRGLTDGMTEWVMAQVLRYHVGHHRYEGRQDGIWRNGEHVPPLARQRVVGFLGLGELGRDAALRLSEVGFDVIGWSRGRKQIAGLRCFSGEDGLAEVLRQATILVLLLPKTSATENILNAERLALMPKGACLINPGRGALIDDSALLTALDNGHIAHATLDVFRTEPLPPAHPYWAHPHVTVTPHVASETRADTASDSIAENIRRGEAGVPLLHLVDRALGY